MHDPTYALFLAWADSHCLYCHDPVNGHPLCARCCIRPKAWSRLLHRMARFQDENHDLTDKDWLKLGVTHGTSDG